jgi:hypothetical protein
MVEKERRLRDIRDIRVPWCIGSIKDEKYYEGDVVEVKMFRRKKVGCAAAKCTAIFRKTTNKNSDMRCMVIIETNDNIIAPKGEHDVDYLKKWAKVRKLKGAEADKWRMLESL